LGSSAVTVVLLFLTGCAHVAPRQPPVSSAVTPPQVYHTVEKGQTMWRIAHMYGVDLRALMAANGITDSKKIDSGRKLLIPVPGAAAVSLRPAPAADDGWVERLVGSPRGSVTWRTITVHHSATRYGNGKVFDRYHKKIGMGGLFYHFLIGNGNGLRDGEIEVGWRWKQQREVNRRQDIQICLVGNFTKQQLSEKQYQSLKKLIIVLSRRYGIHGDDSVRRHCDIAASDRPTECPGEMFPRERLLNDIKHRI
jgi:LysM repeat protein